jgi:hypothetical protein
MNRLPWDFESDNKLLEWIVGLGLLIFWLAVAAGAVLVVAFLIRVLMNTPT